MARSFVEKEKALNPDGVVGARCERGFAEKQREQ